MATYFIADVPGKTTSIVKARAKAVRRLQKDDKLESVIIWIYRQNGMSKVHSLVIKTYPGYIWEYYGKNTIGSRTIQKPIYADGKLRRN